MTCCWCVVGVVWCGVVRCGAVWCTWYSDVVLSIVVCGNGVACGVVRYVVGCFVVVLCAFWCDCDVVVGGRRAVGCVS